MAVINRMKNRSGKNRKRCPGQMRMMKTAVILYALLTVMHLNSPVYASSLHWQDAYITQAQTALQDSPDASFYLANLDGDEIPELIINSGSVAGSEEIFIWRQDHLESWIYEYYAFGYIPGTNQVHIGGGRQGGYYDEIYRCQDGSFILIASGT